MTPQLALHPVGPGEDLAAKSAAQSLVTSAGPSERGLPARSDDPLPPALAVVFAEIDSLHHEIEIAARAGVFLSSARRHLAELERRGLVKHSGHRWRRV